MRIIYLILILVTTFPAISQGTMAYDFDQAIEICRTRPLDQLEGIWIYPEDKVSVLILRTEDPTSSAFTTYEISVIESDDCRLLPGDIIGTIETTAESNKYQITLFTEKNRNLLQKSHSCSASLSKDADALILKGNRTKKFNLRLNVNLSKLLPNFWRFVRISASGDNKSDATPPVGMMKLYPSYDGNGSSRRQPRYL